MRLRGFPTDGTPGLSYLGKPNGSIIGTIPGPAGDSAYQLALKSGFVGTLAAWLASLKGDKGDKGSKGDPGTGVVEMQAALDLKANAADVVNLTGDQLIDGWKIFRQAVQLFNASPDAWSGTGFKMINTGGGLADSAAGLEINTYRDDAGHAVAGFNAVDSGGAFTGFQALMIALGAGLITLGGETSLSGHKLTNVADATDANDAVNKAQLEAKLAQAVAGLVGTAPEALNTLNELAAALGNDPNFATTVATQIGGKADKTTKVDTGTGLTGGGDLSADRTLAVDFGVGAGKVTQGNDPRLSDTRTPTDGSVTTAKIGDGQVTMAKLGTGKVTGSVAGTATSLVLWTGTQAQYDAIGTKDSSTVYVVS